jgi:hypothetical protein
VPRVIDCLEHEEAESWFSDCIYGSILAVLAQYLLLLCINTLGKAFSDITNSNRYSTTSV